MRLVRVKRRMKTILVLIEFKRISNVFTLDELPFLQIGRSSDFYDREANYFFRLPFDEHQAFLIPFKDYQKIITTSSTCRKLVFHDIYMMWSRDIIFGNNLVKMRKCSLRKSMQNLKANSLLNRVLFSFKN